MRRSPDSTAVAIIGSTGSIGRNTLRVIEGMSDRYHVTALGAGRSVESLAGQIRAFLPDVVAVAGPAEADRLAELLAAEPPSRMPEILHGTRGLTSVAAETEASIVVSAAVGSLGFIPTYEALRSGKRVALANKETLVVAGELMMEAVASSGGELLPIDSEHNALHQCMRGERTSEVRRLVLTASGGPFRETPLEALASVTRDQALNHPTWRMGDKITIDSATLMNKGLEVIEAHWLFGFPGDKVDIVVHPQSIVHSMVEFVDGSVMAQMGVTDMRHAIQYALTYPDRCESPCGRLDLTSMGKLEFFEPDPVRFPCVRLAYEALWAGGTATAVLNGANEAAVAAFLAGAIDFPGIPRLVEDALSAHVSGPADTIEAVLAADAFGRERVDRITGLSGLTGPAFSSSQEKSC